MAEAEAREIADRNFSNFPNGSFLVEKSSGQLKGTTRISFPSYENGS